MNKKKNGTTAEVSRLILASASPQRAALLREYGYEFEVIIPPVHEPDELAGHPAPERQAEALSYFKARGVAELVGQGIILAADTVVALSERVFGKPADRNDARRILQSLAGTTHRVITGTTLLEPSTGKRLIEHDSTAVTMRRLTEEELEQYLGTGAWADKAGAYGIQDRGDAFIERIEGSFTNVVGLPMELVSQMLRSWDFSAMSSAEKPPSDLSPSPSSES